MFLYPHQHDIKFVFFDVILFPLAAFALFRDSVCKNACMNRPYP